jgi:hypothetical protein
LTVSSCSYSFIEKGRIFWVDNILHTFLQNFYRFFRFNETTDWWGCTSSLSERADICWVIYNCYGRRFPRSSLINCWHLWKGTQDTLLEIAFSRWNSKDAMKIGLKLLIGENWSISRWPFYCFLYSFIFKKRHCSSFDLLNSSFAFLDVLHKFLKSVPSVFLTSTLR